MGTKPLNSPTPPKFEWIYPDNYAYFKKSKNSSMRKRHKILSLPWLEDKTWKVKILTDHSDFIRDCDELEEAPFKFMNDRNEVLKLYNYQKKALQPIFEKALKDYQGSRGGYDLILSIMNFLK